MREPALAACPNLRAYLDRIGAEVLNFRRFMVKIHHRGYYQERILITVEDDFTLRVQPPDPAYIPTIEEFEAIRAELQAAGFPQPVETKTIDTIFDHIPRDATLFKFVSRITNNIIMVHQRLEFEGGGKAYLPWTFFSDGIWRRMEPGGALPFWKPYERRNKPSIMVHEGAKAAHFIDDLLHNPARIEELKAHPWGDFFSQYEHWGLIGGALAPQRADYNELIREQAQEVVYICDNDFEGKDVLQKFSKCYKRPMKGVMFEDSYPKSWDCAEPIPASHFHKSGRYILSRHIRNCLIPATYATETVIIDEKPHNKLSSFFKREWFHSIIPDAYIHRDQPNKILTTSEFEDQVNPFSAVDDMARLLKRDQTSKHIRLIYDPSLQSGSCMANGSCMNTYVAPHLPPISGDASPWLRYLKHMFPNESERHEICRWVATLIVHPEIRMRYGLLLISEQQGVGKTTLTDILSGIVGADNVSHPSDSEINSDYNYWAAHKRLVVISEIYAGNSSRTYNKLKSVMTDATISVNQKYKAVYELTNWTHIVASSNSKRALKLSDDDRRWFVPEVTESRGENSFWYDFRAWLEERDGFAIIKNWAINFLKTHPHVSTVEQAPWSYVKREVIEATYSAGEELAMRIFNNVATTLMLARQYVKGGDNSQAVIDAHTNVESWKSEHRYKDGNVVILDTDMVRAIKDFIHDGRSSQYMERPLTIRRIAKASGWHISKKPIFMKGWSASNARIISNNPEWINRDPREFYNKKLEEEKQHLLPLNLSDTTVQAM